MSRAYRISVQESLSRHIQVEDGVTSSLELLPILSADRMREILARELLVRSFNRNANTASRVEADGTTVSINLDTGELTASIERHTEVHAETERATVVDERHVSVEAEKAALKVVAVQLLDGELAQKEAAMRKAISTQLEGTLRDLKVELDGVVNRVTANALKERAQELGQVEEVHEDANGNLTIKIRV